MAANGDGLQPRQPGEHPHRAADADGKEQREGGVMNIGDTVYRFDGNRRVYRDRSASGGGGPIYREHFEPLKIVGENNKSWLVDRGWKIDKKTGKGNAASFQFGGRGFFTAEQMEDDIWDHEHRHKIVDAIQREISVGQLKQVAAIIGYSVAG